MDEKVPNTRVIQHVTALRTHVVQEIPSIVVCDQEVHLALMRLINNPRRQGSGITHFGDSGESGGNVKPPLIFRNALKKSARK